MEREDASCHEFCEGIGTLSDWFAAGGLIVLGVSVRVSGGSVSRLEDLESGEGE
jgi:hypothetical protein